MNTSLLKTFGREEVEKTLRQMASLKSPVLDGFRAIFYQKHWKIVGADVCVVVLSILNGEGMTPKLNSTFIALISKKFDAKCVSGFRPISFCNLFYKLVSKVLTNRLKPIMHDIISSNHNAFISGRLITDNIMITHELFHTLKSKTKEKL